MTAENRAALEGARQALDLLLSAGIADDPIDHARQIAMITSIISDSFEDAGMRATLVGGSAIEIFAPGIFKTGDIDLVIEAETGPDRRERFDPVFAALGFEKSGRHWKRGDLFVEVPSQHLADPSEIVRVGAFVVRVVAKEVLLADRVIGFKYWKYLAYGAQAIEMLSAFGSDLNEPILRRRLDQEGAADAFEELRALASSNDLVTSESLEGLLQQLHPDRRIVVNPEE
jgi:hypothetical protein